MVEPAPGDGPQNPAFRYVLDENGKSIAEPGDIGPPIVLTRGVPVAIDVVNHLKEATAVHWHGIELQDSYYDGVSGYSGAGARLAPMIDPGQTFEVRMTPPRAGTFIYHTHMFDVYQLRGRPGGTADRSGTRSSDSIPRPITSLRSQQLIRSPTRFEYS